MDISKEDILKKANAVSRNTLMETLNIEMVDYGEDFLVARMPVDSRVHQPDGVLHGGATGATLRLLLHLGQQLAADEDEVGDPGRNQRQADRGDVEQVEGLHRLDAGRQAAVGGQNQVVEQDQRAGADHGHGAAEYGAETHGHEQA